MFTQEKYNFFLLSKSGFNPFIWNENGIIETLQVFFIIGTLFNVFIILKKNNLKHSNKFFHYFLIFYFFCIFYYFLEEISWGQHYFSWETWDFFIKYNNQKETNIHNISNIFDQLPRSLLLIWCSVSFILYEFIKKKGIKNIILDFILPSKDLRFISYLLIFFFIPDFLLGKLFSDPDYTQTFSINFTDIYNFLTFNFIRLSEYHEFIFTFYIFWHSIFYKKVILAKN